MGKIKIQCEAIARHSGKRCRCKGYFTPTSRRMLCTYHKGSKSWDHKTRKYKGLYRNNNIDIQAKINMLKNLKNFKNKTDDEIKSYIQDQEQRANTLRYRTKYYNRSYSRWRNSVRVGKRFTDQIDNAIQILGSKPKDKREI